MWRASRFYFGTCRFLTPINDLPYNVKHRLYIYGDDTTFLETNSNVNVLRLNVDKDLSEASYWFAADSLLLNENKTNSVGFSSTSG